MSGAVCLVLPLSSTIGDEVDPSFGRVSQPLHLLSRERPAGTTRAAARNSTTRHRVTATTPSPRRGRRHQVTHIGPLHLGGPLFAPPAAERPPHTPVSTSDAAPRQPASGRRAILRGPNVSGCGSRE